MIDDSLKFHVHVHGLDELPEELIVFLQLVKKNNWKLLSGGMMLTPEGDHQYKFFSDAVFEVKRPTEDA